MAFLRSNTNNLHNLVILLTAAAAATLVMPLARAAPSSDWHGFDESCESWHTEPSGDGTQILLVARCYNDNWGASRSEADIVCSELDLNNCLEPIPEGWNWLNELRPKQSANDGKFFPGDCSEARIDTGTETAMGTICNKIGEAGTIHGSVDIGMYICTPRFFSPFSFSSSFPFLLSPPSEIHGQVNLRLIVTSGGKTISSGGGQLERLSGVRGNYRDEVWEVSLTNLFFAYIPLDPNQR
ncbi:hypothetical protein F5X99DRAFT_388818 [Biscogniauxia marginata]|nr:hypothetical protein F5X99DRAFT_388818 [Biscogniauxia marginata]